MFALLKEIARWNFRFKKKEKKRKKTEFRGAPKKKAKNRLKRFKMQILKFDSISLTGESPIDKENSI